VDTEEAIAVAEVLDVEPESFAALGGAGQELGGEGEIEVVRRLVGSEASAAAGRHHLPHAVPAAGHTDVAVGALGTDDELRPVGAVDEAAEGGAEAVQCCRHCGPTSEPTLSVEAI